MSLKLMHKWEEEHTVGEDSSGRSKPSDQINKSIQPFSLEVECQQQSQRARETAQWAKCLSCIHRTRVQSSRPHEKLHVVSAYRAHIPTARWVLETEEPPEVPKPRSLADTVTHEKRLLLEHVETSTWVVLWLPWGKCITLTHKHMHIQEGFFVFCFVLKDENVPMKERQSKAYFSEHWTFLWGTSQVSLPLSWPQSGCFQTTDHKERNIQFHCS